MKVVLTEMALRNGSKHDCSMEALHGMVFAFVNWKFAVPVDRSNCGKNTLSRTGCGPDEMSSAGAQAVRLNAVGGGSKNRTWPQTVTDISRAPRDFCPTMIGASCGDAIFGRAGERIDQRSPANCRWISMSGENLPNPKTRKTCEQLLENITSYSGALFNCVGSN